MTPQSLPKRDPMMTRKYTFQNEKITRFTLRLPEELKNKVIESAIRHENSLNREILELLEEALGMRDIRHPSKVQ